jgi:uncharacterized protein (TIGR00369 family)
MQNSPDIFELVRTFMAEDIPFNRLLGIQVDELRRGHARLSIPFRPEFIGDSMRPALHGGVISALLDTAGGAAVWTTVTASDRVSTIDLRVDYLLPGRAAPLVVDANVVRSGNRVGVVTMRAFHPDAPDSTVADGKGVYNIKRGTPPLRGQSEPST